MRILFVYTNIGGFHADTYSFGIASILAYTLKQGHEARVTIVKTEAEFESVLEALRDFSPHVVGFTSVSSQFQFVARLAAEVKANKPEVRTVCGGVHPTIHPDCLREAPYLDGIFIGESEYAFAEYLERLERGESMRDLQNYASMNGGDLIRPSLRPLIQNLDDLPPPDRSVYPYEDTLQATGYAPFMFSRGCPFNCTYCSNHAIAKMYGAPRNYVRMRSPESSIREITETLERFPFISNLLMDDDIFGLDKAWRSDFLDLYMQHVRRDFMCLLRVNVVDDEFLGMLKRARCKRISFGVESGNDYIRNTVMKRNLKRETIVQAFCRAKAHGIETNAINIIGLPGETESMMMDTVRLNRELSPTNSCVNVFYPYKGTQLGDHCYANGLVDEARAESGILERRQSVLHFPEEHHEAIRRIYDNWQTLVYPYDYATRFMRTLRGSSLWTLLRKAKGRLRKLGLVR